MNIEEKNLPEAEETIEDTTPVATENKKLSPAIIGGIIGGAVALVAIVVIIILSLAGGGEKCTSHVDADDDYKCDTCGVDYDDGEEAAPITTVKVNFNVKLDNGQSLSGITFVLTRGDNTYSFVSDANGKATLDLEPGSYAISDYTDLPENCIVETPGFKVTQTSTSFDIIIVDNTPDGSKDKPFFISEENTEITLEPGQELYYNFRGSNLVYVNIYVDGVILNYDGDTYSFEGDKLTATLLPEIGVITTFSVKNVSSETITTNMELMAPLGSRDNPIELTENFASTSVSESDMIYYKWTSDKDGILVLTSPTLKNSISIAKVLENDVIIESHTAGKSAVYLAVSEGEVVTIGVSVTGSTEKLNVEFSLDTYAGTDADPVPALINEIDVSIAQGMSVAFVAEAGKVVTIEDESPVTLINNGASYSGSEGNKITATLTEGVFVVRNDAEHTNGITIEIQ